MFSAVGKLVAAVIVLGLAACGSRSPHAGSADASTAGDTSRPIVDAVGIADAPVAADAPIVPGDAPIATDAPPAATDVPGATDAPTAGDTPAATDATPDAPRCTAGEARCAPPGRRQRCNASGAWDAEEYACTVALSGSSDYDTMCAIKADGRLNCWAAGDWQNMQAAKMVAEAPGASGWRQISVGDGAYRLCAVNTTGIASCWSYDRQQIAVPPATYASLSFSDYGSCALSQTGSPTCFGGVTLPADFVGRFTHIVTANYGVYGIDEAGGLHAPSFALPAYPAGKYVHLVANNSASCAVRDDGSIFCFPTDNMLPPPSGADFTQVATTYANKQGCAIRRDGTLACWVGEPTQPPLSPAPPGNYVHIAGSNNAMCGIRTDGSTVCWSRPGVDALVAPDGW